MSKFDIDQVALDTVKTISEIDPDKLKGGTVQAKAQAQCLVIDAMEQAQKASREAVEGEIAGYQCHHCDAETSPPKPFSMSVHCERCGHTTAATIAADLYTHPASAETVPMPTTPEQARGMALIGTEWLRCNAPELMADKQAVRVPEGRVSVELGFTPEHVVEAGKDCIRTLEKSGINDTRTVATTIFQDMLLATSLPATKRMSRL